MHLRSYDKKMNEIFFKDNSTVCFFGDSITANGKWIAQMYQKLKNDYAKKNITLYNCGVSGDCAYNAYDRLYIDCLVHKPDYVSLMFGVNDIDIVAYENNDTKRENNAFEKYTNSMLKIINKLLSLSIKVILCTPPIYDEYSNVEAKNLRCNRGLTRCSELIRDTAEKYDLKVIEFNPFFNENRDKYNLVCSDRVHPSDFGYNMMAQLYMQQTGMVDTLSEIPLVLDEKNQKRFDAESDIRAIAFVNWCVMYKDHTLPLNEKVEKMKRFIAENKIDENDFTYQKITRYLEIAYLYENIQNELLNYTINIY